MFDKVCFGTFGRNFKLLNNFVNVYRCASVSYAKHKKLNPIVSIMTISNRTLIQIAAWGGFIVSSTGFYLSNRLVDRYRGYDYYKQALKSLRTHAGAVYYLGEPIKDRRFKITDPESNHSDEEKARFAIPVSGPKDRGTFYIWASKEQEEWKLTKAELELKSKPDARLVIVKENTV